MKHLTTWSFFIFFICILYKFSSAQEASEYEGIHLKSKTLSYLISALSIWDEYEELRGVLYPNTNLSASQQIALLAMKVDEMPKYYHNDILSIFGGLDRNPESEDLKNHALSRWTLLYVEINNFITVVSKIEADFEVFISKMKFTNSGYKYVQTVSSHEISTRLVTLIKTLTTLKGINLDSSQSLFNSVLQIKQVCSSKSSVQQNIYRLYQTSHSTLIKALLMLTFAYAADENSSSVVNDKAITAAIADYFIHVRDLVNLFHDSIVKAPRGMWMCDPQRPEEGKTYERFGPVFQKYLFNEKNAHPNLGFAINDKFSCLNSCENIDKKIRSSPSSAVDKEKGENFMHKDDASKRCYGGHLRNCKTIEEDSIELCTTELNQVERYSYLKYGNKTYGSKSSCRRKVQTISRPVPKWYDYIALPRRCLYCMCTCVHDHHGGRNSYELQRSDIDRYIDLRPVTTDEGYVITGIRLRKVSAAHIFHLEIKQAKLLANGRVSKAHWKSTSSYYPRTTEHPFDLGSEQVYQENIDYHRVTWNRTTFYLGDVVSSRNDELVTGVRFQTKSNDKNGQVYLGMAVKLSEFDFDSGNLKGKDEWYSEDGKSVGHRKEVIVDDHNLPTQFNGKNIEISGESTSVNLGNSGLVGDVGQNILPFIDIQPIETKPSVPLAGVGLYHRGSKGSGGYLGLKATIFNLESYLPHTASLTDQHQKLLESTTTTTE